MATVLRAVPRRTPAMLTALRTRKTTTRKAPEARGPLSAGSERRSVGREYHRDRRHRHGAEDPEEHAGLEAQEGPERRLHVGVGPAGQVDAAAGLGEAEDDEAHGDRADEVGEGGRRPEPARHVRGQTEDPSAHGDVDDAGGEPEHADRAQEGRLGDRRRRIWHADASRRGV